ncbi:MAG: YlmH/Sll1252 family protein [Acetivibrio sp.]
MNQEKEDILFCKRVKELSQRASQKGIYTFSDFANLNELNLFHKTIREVSDIDYHLWGGYPEAERRVICFKGKYSLQKSACLSHEDDSFNDVVFPIQCLSIKPVQEKFSDILGHRDYLGAILNLGIERSKIGDILVLEKEAFVFCHMGIAEFLIDNLNKIKHTKVTINMVTYESSQIRPKTEEIFGTVSSVRLDVLLGIAFSASRSSLTGLISGEKVFVNGKLITSNSFIPNENDIVSVRGYGKFIFRSIQKQTKKNRYRILIEKYSG